MNKNFEYGLVKKWIPQRIALNKSRDDSQNSFQSYCGSNFCKIVWKWIKGCDRDFNI
jgi:hypothetical protein